MYLKLLQNIKKLTLVDLPKPFKSRLYKTIVVLFSISLAGSVFAEGEVSSQEEIAQQITPDERGGKIVIKHAKPGDIIEIADGKYENLKIVFNVNGTQDNPIRLKAETQGKVVLTGDSELRIAGDYLIVDGLKFLTSDKFKKREVIRFYGKSNDPDSFANYSRLTNTTIDGDDGGRDPSLKYHLVHVRGSHNEIDHNLFTNMKFNGVAVLVSRRSEEDSDNDDYPNVEDFHHIHHNYFNKRISYEGEPETDPESRPNGQETIKIGSGSDARTNEPSRTIVEYNLFSQINAETEIISSKSDSNIFRYNTLHESQGALTLRNAKDNEVYGNFIDGDNVLASWGIRIVGKGHRVYNNQIENTEQAAITIYGGDDDNVPGYKQADNLEVFNNTIINSKVALVIGEQGESNYEKQLIAPTDSIIANNAIYHINSTTLFGYGVLDDDKNRKEINVDGLNVPVPQQLNIEESITFRDNIVYGDPNINIKLELARLGVEIDDSQVKQIDPGLEVKGGVWIPVEDAPVESALDAVSINFDLANIDIRGLSRDSIHDVGAAEYTYTRFKSVNKPLTKDDVGPKMGLAQPEGPRIIVVPAAATYVDINQPKIDFGESTTIKVKTGEKIGFMTFDVSRIDAEISNAILHLKTKTSDSGPITINKVSDNEWAKIGIIWETRPEIDYSADSMITENGEDDLHQVDITDYVKAQIEDKAMLSLAFSQTTGPEIKIKSKTIYLEIILAPTVGDQGG